MKKEFIVAVASIFVCMQSAYPQITTNEPPVSVQRGLGAITGKTAGAIDLPVPDIKKLLQEDLLKQEKDPDGIQRTAVSIPIEIDINKDGIWSTLEDGGRLWQMEIHAEKALALDFVFSKFWLPKEGKFFLFNPSTKETIGAITSKYLFGDKDKPHRFSTGVLKGDRIILEYYQPIGEKELPVIKVEKAYYTYIPAPYFLSVSTCSYEVNVNCSEGSNWQLEKNAVALVYYKNDDESGWCSGSLVNNTQNNLAPLFLTADHCVGTKDAISDNDLSDWVFYWGYELESCSSTTQPNYSSKTTIGATLIANNSYTDFALLQLEQDPLNIPGYIPYYLGWDASGSSGTGGVCIHHPNHDVKKISTYSCMPSTASYDSSPFVYWGVQWDATANGHGITELGSSGSPLINNYHRVIGQLTGASNTLNCSNLTGGTSKFGKLSVSWTGNGNSDYRRRLDYWLDVNGSNTNVINGFSLYDLCSSSSISGPSTICSSSTNTYTINDLPSGFTINWGVDNNNFSITPSGNQCLVTYTGTPQYSVANLTATVLWNSTTIKTLTKRIVMHGTDLVVYGEQDSYHSSNGLFPYRSFTIPANNGSRSVSERINREVFADKESLPINFIEDNTRNPVLPPIDWCGYGITDINGGNRVYLNSNRFDGMDISFSGPYSPTYFYQSGGYVSFEMPYNSPNYPVTLQAESNGQCHDFCLTFNVVPLPGVLSGDDIIWVNIDGSMLYVTFMYGGEPIGNEQFYFPSYSVTISKIPGGTCVYSNNFSGTQTSFSVNTSTWTSGIYSIRIVCDDNIYSKSICL